MDPLVIGVVALSALLHVAWNVRLKTAGDPLRAATVGMLSATVVIVPAGIVAWLAAGRPALPGEGVALGVASGVVEAGYFVLLSAAYRRGDLSVVYPIARGTAPLLAVAIGVGLFGERLGVAGSVGVVLLLAGFMVLQRPWRALRSGGRGFDPAVAFALATGVTIATYSAIDRLGTQLIDPLEYAAILWVTCAVVLVVWMRFVAGGRILGGGRHGDPAGRSGRLADARGLRPHPVGAQRRAALRRRAVARISDCVRRGLGFRPPRGGRQPR